MAFKKQVSVEQPTSSKDGCKRCGHAKKLHYEGAEDQCNSSGCACLGYVK